MADFSVPISRRDADVELRGGVTKFSSTLRAHDLCANFGTLRAGGIAPSVNVIKRRLWDLKVDRDRDPNGLLVRQHEMIVQSPRLRGSAGHGERQYANIVGGTTGLEAQADQEALRLRPLSTVAEIGEHILTAEAA